MKNRITTSRLRYLTLLIILTLGASAFAQTARPKANTRGSGGTANIPTLLERSKLNYAKIADNIWEIQFTGQNVKEFSMRIVATEDLVLMMVKLADRKDVNGSGVLPLRLLELNDKVDQVKFALSADMLYARVEIHARLLDDSEFRYLVDQLSGGVDENYPVIRPFIAG